MYIYVRIIMHACRAGLQQARVQCNGKTIVGFSIDAADYGKFQTPTTKSTAKLLGGMHRIKNKLTGCEFFSEDRKLFLFRSLPDLTTGANLTLTILTRYILTLLPPPLIPAYSLFTHSTGCSTWVVSIRQKKCLSIMMDLTITSITRVCTR